MQSIFREDTKDRTLFGWISWNLPTILLIGIGLPMTAFVSLSFAYGAALLLLLFIEALLESV